MSNSVNIELDVSCSTLSLLDGLSLTYSFDGGTALDLLDYVVARMALPLDLNYSIKYSALDLFGKQKIATLTDDSVLVDGRTYFLLISPLDMDATATAPSQLIPRSPARSSFVTPRKTNVSFGSLDMDNSTESPLQLTPPYRDHSGFIAPSTSHVTLDSPLDDMDANVTTTPSQLTPTLPGRSNYATPTTSRMNTYRPVPGTRNATAAVLSQTKYLDTPKRSTNITTPEIMADVNETEEERSQPLANTASSSAAEKPVPSTSNTPRFQRLENQLHPTVTMIKSQFLGELYASNKLMMDEIFASMQPDEHFVFFNINIMDRLNCPRNIAAFALLRHVHLADYNLRVGNLARDIAQKFVIDIVMEAKKNSIVPKEMIRPLVTFLNDISRNDFFDTLLRSQGPLSEALRKRESRDRQRQGFVVPKKMKLMFTSRQVQDIDAAAKTVATAHTQEEVVAVLKASSPARCQWILSMVQQKTVKIPETVIAKFPVFKTNGTWLEFDFQYTMENIYKMPLFNIADVLERYAPAIAAVAVDRNVIPQHGPGIQPYDPLKMTEILIDLLGLYTRQKNVAKVSRLVIFSQELPNVDEMMTQRLAMKQIAPMIFVIRDARETQYYVSTDDFALKVPGNFGNALHSLVALHFVLYIEYAKELINFNLFLENLCGLKMKKMNKARETLLFDVQTKMRTLAIEDNSNGT